jgi:hypothetical protein
VAWLHLSGDVNSQNPGSGAVTVPTCFMTCHYFPRKLTVVRYLVNGLYEYALFFSETVTAEKYQEIIMQFISLLNKEKRVCWLQQDVATCHTANSTMEMLKQFFDDRIISKNLWPPRSLDLTLPDYFVWGYLKQVVFSNRPQIIEDLKQNIETTILNMFQETLRK